MQRRVVSPRVTFLMAAGALLIPALARAQVARHEGLTIDGARRVIAAGIAYASKNSAPGAVLAVVDEGGNLMAVERLDGTFPAGANVSIGKARTAALFRKPTRVFEDIVNKGRVAMTALPDFTPLQGGVPIVAGGAIVGAIGVSGAASAQQDEEIAIAGAAAIAATDTGAVRYYGRADVETSFAKGAVLDDGHGNRSFMVHTSRRDAAGMAEVHALDTDVVHVVSGSATLVTGGAVENPREVEAGETRGSGIAGGERRRISAGDVVIVPNGVPHWFQEVPEPITYFVVKVRR